MAALPDRLRRILDAEYPRFSGAEMARRRNAVEALLATSGLDHLIYCGLNRTGSAVQWLTQWPVTAEAVGVLSPGRADALFVQYFNHVPLARRLKPGLTERELGDLVERAYVADGGTNVIHFFGVTPMHAPEREVPAQFPSTRRVQHGDVVVTEIAAAFWDYPGQVLRSF